jgi:PadR family transcriptional regulator PadR
MRRTRTLVKVALVMMQDPHCQHYGWDIARRADILSGSLYPLLRKMLDNGWLTDDWEDQASVSNRPPRRYYELTPLGRDELNKILTAARQERRFQRLMPNTVEKQ